MGAKKNIITINGRTYDAKTGRVVDDAPAKLHSPHIITPQTVKPTTGPVRSKPRQITVKQVVSSKRDTGQTAHTIHVKTERSKTLRRTGLSKPAIRKSAQAVTGLVGQPKHRVVGKSSHAPHTGILKSHQIVKFGSNQPAVTHKTSTIPVRSAPVSHWPKSAQKGYNIHDTPPAPRLAKATTVATPTPNIFESALAAATSHQSVHFANTRRAKRRLRSTGALLLAIILLGGFFTYQNAPRIALHQASSQIGFEASLPTYKPAGFRLSGAVQYQRGLVLANFRSNSDDRAYTVTQSKATFDNSSLADQLKATNKSYSTVVIDGHKIYLAGSMATWVLHDVWYTIEGNASLSSDQLTKIAASM